MGDLIERLRMGTQVPEFELRQDAADEIERLTHNLRILNTGLTVAEAEIERLCGIVETQEDALKEFHAEIEQLRAGCDRLHGYIAEKDAEIERLRKHLPEDDDE